MTRHRYSLAITIGLLLVTVGCAQRSDDPGPGSAPNDTGGKTVTVERTGGFAGRHDTTIIKPGGEWTRTDRAGEQRSGRLNPDQQDELSRLVTDPKLPDEARREPGDSRCADTFRYRLTIDSTTISYIECPGAADLPNASMAIVAFVESATAG